jgi:hypothetical protein
MSNSAPSRTSRNCGPGSAARSELRVSFAFDPWRSAILLVAGDKSGNSRQWYRQAIPRAEQVLEIFLKERAQEGGGPMTFTKWSQIRDEQIERIGREQAAGVVADGGEHGRGGRSERRARRIRSGQGADAGRGARLAAGRDPPPPPQPDPGPGGQPELARAGSARSSGAGCPRARRWTVTLTHSAGASA